MTSDPGMVSLSPPRDDVGETGWGGGGVGGGGIAHACQSRALCQWEQPGSREARQSIISGEWRHVAGSTFKGQADRLPQTHILSPRRSVRSLICCMFIGPK